VNAQMLFRLDMLPQSVDRPSQSSNHRTIADSPAAFGSWRIRRESNRRCREYLAGGIEDSIFAIGHHDTHGRIVCDLTYRDFNPSNAPPWTDQRDLSSNRSCGDAVGGV